MNGPNKLWTPDDDFITRANLTAYMTWLREKKGLAFSNYDDLWSWSVNSIGSFWESLLEYFEVQFDGSYREVYTGAMPKTKWFVGIKMNYAEHIFRNYSESRPAIIAKSEGQETRTINWQDLKSDVTALQHFFTEQGIQKGDRVAAYLPCIPEATVSFLATNSIGAIWSCCSPDFGSQSVIDRFAQIEPKILIAASAYRYGGKSYDKTEVIEEVLKAIPSIKKVILIYKNGNIANEYISWEDALTEKKHQITFTRVPFNHPIWVLYSSGTSGLPKPIVHSVGGILLEQLKYLTFHKDAKPGDRCFWFTTTGWMMWNHIQGTLLCGSTVVLYDGSPGYPNLYDLWKFAEEASINHFGTSASFIIANMKEGLSPGKQFNLRSIRSIGSTGSPLPPEGFDWIYREVKDDVWLTSVSGGTDVCSAFVGGNPLWPVYEGEIQCRALGCSLEAFDESGQPVYGQVGEMVITQPMPSMPVFFWNDPDFKRYTESYFDLYPRIWRHGDWISITPRKGVIIYGRSDATLNRGGVRIGSAEIYRTLDKIPEVKDSLIICIEKAGGEFYMPLFVMLSEGSQLDDSLKKKINEKLKSECSPRHVPDEILECPDIPYTLSGKKTETPVKKILMGFDPGKVINAGSLRNPHALDYFTEKAKNARS